MKYIRIPLAYFLYMIGDALYDLWRPGAERFLWASFSAQGDLEGGPWAAVDEEWEENFGHLFNFRDV